MKAAVAEAACHRSAADAGIVAIGLFRPVILLLFRWESRNIRDLILISLPPRAREAAGCAWHAAGYSTRGRIPPVFYLYYQVAGYELFNLRLGSALGG
jgi:hypothetical protein